MSVSPAECPSKGVEDESDDEEPPQLSKEALAALLEFRQEQSESAQKAAAAAPDGDAAEESFHALFPEIWQLSQFWYDQKTIDYITAQAVENTVSDGKIALISCPSLYPTFKNKYPHLDVYLFEYDKRFAIYGAKFIQYDFNAALEIDEIYRRKFDLVIADPPFLSEDCLRNVVDTFRFLSESNKIMLCTGAIMEDLALELLGAKKLPFEPSHKNKLSNEFWLYSNFE